jgi:hypothetical protein
MGNCEFQLNIDGQEVSVLRLRAALQHDLRRDLRLCGQGCDRLRPDGTIVPRNNFVGDPIHRVDLRLQQRFPLGGRLSLDGILEAYNLFNHENYGSYEVRESNANYGKPVPLLSLVYQPRMLQLGFRATF